MRRKRGKHTGISKRTLDRARADLRIPAVKRGDGKWWISLPEHEGDLKAARYLRRHAKDATVGTCWQ